MKNRCMNSNDVFYSRYGGRGIRVCDRWLDYSLFLEDMGRKPSNKHTLDRIDNNGDYEPSNCRWATAIEQANNKRNTRFITYKGRTKTIANWAREMGIGYLVLYDRLRSKAVENGADPFEPFV